MAIKFDDVIDIDIQNYFTWNIGRVEEMQGECQKEGREISEFENGIYPLSISTLMDREELTSFMGIINNCLECDIEHFTRKKMFSKNIKNLATELLDDFITDEDKDFKLINCVVSGLPMRKRDLGEYFDLAKEFAYVMYIQFLDSVINEDNINIKPNYLSISSKEVSNNADLLEMIATDSEAIRKEDIDNKTKEQNQFNKLTWRGTRRQLYYLLKLLKRDGCIEMNDTDLAIWIKNCFKEFEQTNTVTIVGELEKILGRPPKQKDKTTVDKIIQEVNDFDT